MAVFTKTKKSIKSHRKSPVTNSHHVQNPQTYIKASYGSVTVKASAPDKSTVKRNIIEGQRALTHAVKTLKTVGVKLPRQKNVPLYYTDEKRPGVLIREYQGKKTAGKIVNGNFSAIYDRPSRTQKSKKGQ